MLVLLTVSLLKDFSFPALINSTLFYHLPSLPSDENISNAHHNLS